MTALNYLLFIGLPYAAMATFIIGTIWRFKATPFRFSSLSSEFLEGRHLFWGSVPFHWGIFFLFFGHLIGFLIPSSVIAWNANPLRLVIIESAAFIFAICMIFGLVNLFLRRVTHQRILMVTNWMDLFIEILLIAEVVAGIYIAFFFRWGSSWFAAVLSPYLWSLFTFSPNIEAISAMHWVIQAHVALAFIIVGLVPFSRMVHFLVYPFWYLWRPYQVVMWNWGRKQVRNPDTKWTMHDPKNN